VAGVLHPVTVQALNWLAVTLLQDTISYDAINFVYAGQYAVGTLLLFVPWGLLLLGIWRSKVDALTT
jgi:hypothetical protein